MAHTLVRIARERVQSLGLEAGTRPENVAAYWLHKAAPVFAQQHRVGRYRLDFAWPAQRLALEIDGPHHHRPDVAHKDALRDAELRAAGWVVLRVNVTPDLEDHVVRVAELVRRDLEVGRARGWYR